MLLACTCRALSRTRSVRPLLSIQVTPRRSRHSPASAPIASTSEIPSIVSRKGKDKAVDRWPGWHPVIGLELHVQLKGNVKLLSSALATYDASPNSHVACFDAALPGSLPTLGAEPVRLALLACLALKSNINQASAFDRKHYFYPDLPAGFQVTQKYSPLASGGSVRVRRDNLGQSETFDVRINQIQLEQDTAKSSHDPLTGLTLVDLNRAGAALVEIVTEPDMRSPEDAAAFVRHLQSILRHVGASDANMDRGELRCDVNVSVQRSAAGSPFGARCEVKNLNGVKFLMGAIESEVKRQIADLEAGRPVEQATRGYDAVTSETFHLRSKEDAPDYRYMPDPELGPIIVAGATLASLQATLPELPDEAFDRLQSQYKLSARDASVLVALGEGMDESSASASGHAGSGVAYFEDVARGRDARLAANWVIHELLGQLAKVHLSLATSPVAASELGLLVDAVAGGKLSGTSAKAVLGAFIASPTASTIPQLIGSHLSSTLSDERLSALCDEVIASLPDEVLKVRAGQQKVLMRLVGEVMKRSGGNADAKQVTGLLRRTLM